MACSLSPDCLKYVVTTNEGDGESVNLFDLKTLLKYKKKLNKKVFSLIFTSNSKNLIVVYDNQSLIEIFSLSFLENLPFNEKKCVFLKKHSFSYGKSDNLYKFSAKKVQLFSSEGTNKKDLLYIPGKDPSFDPTFYLKIGTSFEVVKSESVLLHSNEESVLLHSNEEKYRKISPPSKIKEVLSLSFLRRDGLIKEIFSADECRNFLINTNEKEFSLVELLLDLVLENTLKIFRLRFPGSKVKI